jgi:glyoxalase family protein
MTTAPHATSLPALAGIHHVTAIASDPQRNLDFYTKVLGMHLVKLTVNFDDPGSYHFYFGNAAGSPGTILTFFPWPHVKRGIHGAGTVSETAFAAPRSSLAFWLDRLHQAGLSPQHFHRFGTTGIAFEDPDGMHLEIVGVDAPAGKPFSSADIPSEHALRGFFSVTLRVRRAAATLRLLTSTMGLREAGRESTPQGTRVRLLLGDDQAPGQTPGRLPGLVADVLEDPHAPDTKLGAGIVHHVAWRVPDLDREIAWQQALSSAGVRVTPVQDRSYFQSVYYREPGGVLYELATDGPGFAIDESPDALGEALRLPDMHRHAEQHIRTALPRITLPTGKNAP